MQTLYDVLGVTPGADQPSIRRAYLHRTKETHPDALRRRGLPDDSEAFLLVQRAYETLRDPTLRALYDAELVRVGRRASPPPARGADTVERLQVPLAVAVRGGSVLHGTMPLTIPVGTVTGDRLRLRGRGGAGRPRGDLILEVEVLEDPHWRLRGLDLYVALPVTWLEAYRGGVVRLRTPWRTVHLALEPGTPDGTVFELAGDGLRRDGQRGDLFAAVELRPPIAGDAALEGVLMRLQGLANPRAEVEASFA